MSIILTDFLYYYSNEGGGTSLLGHSNKFVFFYYHLATNLGAGVPQPHMVYM